MTTRRRIESITASLSSLASKDRAANPAAKAELERRLTALRASDDDVARDIYNRVIARIEELISTRR